MDRDERGYGGQGRFAPVKVGDELDVKIEAVGEKGDGIAKKDGFVLFIPNTKEGDEVRVRVTKVLRRLGFAEVVEGGGAAEEPSEESSEEPSEEKAAEDLDEEVEESSEEQPEDSENFGEEEKETE